jgi:uncharacterized protein (DUF2235 family)
VSAAHEYLTYIVATFYFSSSYNMAERSPQPTASMGTRSSGGKAWSDFVPPKKRLVICCDGTWQSSNHGRHTTPSNIAKLSRAISQYFVEDEKAGVQVCYYDAGVGTGLPSGIMGEIYKNYTGMYYKVKSRS